jgi:hypothetical protein
MKLVVLAAVIISAALVPVHPASDDRVTFSKPPASVDVYDFFEMTVNVKSPRANNPSRR